VADRDGDLFIGPSRARCIRFPVADIKYFSVFHSKAGHVTGEVPHVDHVAHADKW